MADVRIVRAAPEAVSGLARLLVATVSGGASLGFIEPFDEPTASAFWTGWLADSANIVLAAHRGEDLVGTVSVSLAQPANAAHRAEIRKLMVDPGARQRGVGAALMAAAEAEALARGRWLLVLDTVQGSAAEPFYRGLGYVTAGVIPEFARAPREDRLEPTVVFYKLLEPRTQPDSRRR